MSSECKCRKEYYAVSKRLLTKVDSVRFGWDLNTLMDIVLRKELICAFCLKPLVTDDALQNIRNIIKYSNDASIDFPLFY